MKESSNQLCLLKVAEKQELDAMEFGFYWESIHQLIEQIQSECSEVLEAWKTNNSKHLQEEIGDIIQAAIGLAVFCRFDPQETLSKSIAKFQQRYDAVVDMAKMDGHQSLHQQPFNILMDYWNRAKLKSNVQS